MSKIRVIRTQDLRITIVYDNTAYDPNLKAEWGFAALLEYDGYMLLFDNGGTLLDNMEKLGINPRQIEVVVLSHIHEDHTGGLQDLLLAAGSRLVRPVSLCRAIHSW